MIRPELLDLLRCPETHQKLALAPPELLATLNAKIKEGQLRNRAGKALDQPLDGGLLCEDGTVLYPVRGNLPIMLIDEAIVTGVKS